jgi:hypothetical protein
MTVLTPTATIRRDATGAVIGKGEAGVLVHFGARTVELAAASSASTVDFGNIPSNARIAGCSRIYWDDLATSGSPTLDLGLFAVDSNITSDDDALNDGLDISAVSTAQAGNTVIKDIANYGKKAYEFVNGQTSDPKGALKIKGTVRDAATNKAGTITLDLYGYLD